MSNLYTVFGNPIAHSLSPLIHAHFAQSLGEKIIYTRTLAPLNDFSGSLKAFGEEGGQGANVTVPFKEDAYQLCITHSERAKQAKAVNTLIRIDNKDNFAWHGDNTDGIGLVADIQRLGVDIAQKNILILGAGGAARGVLHPLKTQNPHSITIANRTLSKAESLADEFSLQAASFSCLKANTYDIIINATSASLHGEVPPINPSLFQAAQLCYDMVYHQDKHTIFNTFAQSQGCLKTADGLGMLLAQAAASYQLWRGKTPDITPLFHLFRQPEEK